MELKYSDFLSVDERFQTSINLEFDLNDIRKIESYIPTAQSVDILDQYLRTIYYESTDRASVLIGPYGRGKSHLFLVLLALVSLGNQDSTVIKTKRALVAQISAINPETGKLAEEIAFNRKPLLPVVINATGGDITQSFILAIKDSLERFNLSKLLPSTYFDSAYEMIQMWKRDFPEAISSLNRILKKEKTNIQLIEVGLKRYDRNAYALFCKAYPQVALGATFNPLVNTNIIKLYTSILSSLCETTGYMGIFVVFDEFSKYLESALDNGNMLDFQLIQELAEFAQRSGNQQFHFACVTHKDILSYSNSDSFKTVEGRFHNIHFVATSEQCYELIENTIQKNNDYLSFVQTNYEGVFADIRRQAPSTGLFDDISVESFDKTLVIGCFPLAPLTSYCLLRVSERVAQNERTMFTFLSGTAKNTLASFLKKTYKKVTLYTVDGIYDYFEDIFRKEIFNQVVHRAWAKTDSALMQIADNTVQSKIIKAIAIINIISDGKLLTIKTHLKAALMLDDIDFDEAIQGLLQKSILHQKASGEFVLLTANGVDIRNCINNTINTTVIEESNEEILNRLTLNKYILPRQYNDQFSIIRYLYVSYISTSDFIEIQSAIQLLHLFQYDGVVLIVLCSGEEERDMVQEHITMFVGHPQIIICLNTINQVPTRDIKEYCAIQIIKATPVANDTHFKEELELFEDDVIRNIRRYCQDAYNPSNPNCHYYNYIGELDGIDKVVKLNRKVSEIISGVFSKTPNINNEMINKEIVTSQIRRARTLVISHLFQFANNSIIQDIEGFGPEVSIFHATIKNKQLATNGLSDDIALNEVLEHIMSFLHDSSKKKMCVGALYKTLQSPPYGIRKGIIPIYLGYVIRDYREEITVFFDSKEIELTPSLIDRMNDTPDLFEIKLEQSVTDQEVFITELENMFLPYVTANIAEKSRVYRVLACMQTWIRALPKYSREYNILINSNQTQVSDSMQAFRKEMLRYDLSPREFLFSWIPNVLGNLATPVLDTIATFKKGLDNHINVVKSELTKYIIRLLAPDYAGQLTGALRAWSSTLEGRTVTHLFSSEANELIRYAQTASSHDSDSVLQGLSNIITLMDIEDWSDGTATYFLSKLQKTIAEIDEYNRDNSIDSNNDECSVAININGEMFQKSFIIESVSPLGLAALNNVEAAFNEFQDSITNAEKLAILIKLIQEIV